jgi:hypothetical protein
LRCRRSATPKLPRGYPQGKILVESRFATSVGQAMLIQEAARANVVR